ncbi:MAG TPA: type II secretion system F family protein [Actinomycetota bacterium]|nr:type II secretion system F family protein [Actinomycetota bacterium]
MTVLVPVLAGLGLALFAGGIPVLRKVRLVDRVEPYLGGLHGRPSGLYASPSRVGYPRLAARLARRVPPREDLARRLQAAGDERGPDDFRVEQAIWSMGGLSAAVVLTLLAAGAGVDFDPAAVPVFALVVATTGWVAPDWLLGRRIDERRTRLSEELPPALDLLVLALMAGESVPAGLARVAGVLRGSLAAEIEKVLADVRAGAPVVEALEGLARRVDEPAIARFVDALCTGIEKGAPLADVLRAQADDGREQRRRRLLELGGKREVLMLVPVVFLIMPVVVVWALFPGLVSLDLLVP